MPSLQEIEQFKTILNSLGSEPDILAERDEEIEDIPLPQVGLPPDLSELFEAPAAPAPPEEAAPEEAGEAPLPAEEEKPIEKLDFESLFGEEAAEEGAEGLAELTELPLDQGEAALEEAVPGPEEEAIPAGEVVGEVPAGEAEAPAEEAEAPEGEVPEAAPPEVPEAAPPEEEAAVGFEELPDEFAQIPEIPEEFALPEEPTAPPEEPTAPPEEEVPAEEAPLEAEAEEEAIEEFVLPEEAAGEAFEIPEGEAEAPEAEIPAGEEAVEALSEFELPEEFQVPGEEVPGEEVPGEEAPGEVEVGAEGPALEEQAVPEAEAGFGEEEAPAGGPEAEEQIEPEPAAEEALGEEEEFQVDEFSLQGLGEEFGISEEEAAEFKAEEFAEVQVEAPAEEEEEIEAAEEELQLSDEQFSSFRESLNALPKNLKVVIQELVGEKKLGGENLQTLIDLLIKGAAPAVIAAQVSAITGKKIVLPRRFDKRTGLAFEEERMTFAYAFRENILPIIRIFALSLAFISLLVFLGYRFIYRPLFANAQYRRGHEHLLNDRYAMANESFATAVNIWAVKGWFYRYAEAFTEKKQFLFAEQKYDQLRARYPGDRKGTLAYAGLETRHLANYGKSEELLNELLDKNMRDYEALLASGDNYLEWADEDPTRYEEARFSYASILDYYGERDEVLFRMLKYFVRTDKLDEVQNLKEHIESQKLKIDPEVYAELGGYLFDRKEYDDVPEALFKAMEVQLEIPEIHYHLARYFRYAQDPREEDKAIRRSIHFLKAAAPLNKKRKKMLIDSYNRYGETFWRNREYLDAEKQYQTAIKLIEDEQQRRTFGKLPEFGQVYKNRGDIYYYVERNLETAGSLYRKAEDNQYFSPDVDYKIGFIDYAAGRHEDALLRFSKVLDNFSRNENSIFSMANTLYQRGDYFSAQGHYLHLLDILETKKNSIPFMRIEDNPDHRALMEYILKTYNNLGVTLKKLSDRIGDPAKNSRALVNLTFSSENYDIISRDPESLSRGLTKNLAFLNQKEILYPTAQFELQIYNRIPNDLDAIWF
ncbi:hypothetical protein ES703_47351 [subsurface metagenome]